MSFKMTIVTYIPPDTFSILWATTFIQHMTQTRWWATRFIRPTSSNWNTRVHFVFRFGSPLHSIPGGENHHSGWSVEGVPRSNQLPPRIQHISRSNSGGGYWVSLSWLRWFCKLTWQRQELQNPALSSACKLQKWSLLMPSTQCCLNHPEDQSTRHRSPEKENHRLRFFKCFFSFSH